PGRCAGGDRPHPQDAGRGGDAHGVRGQARTAVRRTGLRARHAQPGRRPAGTAARGGAGARGEDRPQLARGDATHQAGVVGRAGDGAHGSVSRRGEAPGRHVGPSRSGRGPARLRGESRAPVDRAGARRGATMTVPSEATEPPEGGRDDYSGPFDPDFRYEDLSRDALVKLVREFALIAHLLDRSVFTAVGMKYGQQAVEELAIAEWMGASPIYTERIRK